MEGLLSTGPTPPNLDAFRNPKILHVACHNPSQIDVTKTLRPFQTVIMALTFFLNLKYCYKWNSVLPGIP